MLVLWGVQKILGALRECSCLLSVCQASGEGREEITMR